MSYFRMSDGQEPSGYSQAQQRMFLREQGWRIAVKTTSDRAFCHAMTPGEQYYHRLAEGEVYVHRSDDKFCLPCAERMGLLDHEPHFLPDARPDVELPPEIADDDPGFDLASD